MKKTFTFTAALCGIVVTTGIVAATTFAAESANDTAGQPCFVHAFKSENGEAARQAIEANDYQAWKTAVGEGPMAEQITAENFSQFAEMHRLMEAGKVEEAKIIADSLGLKKIAFGTKAVHVIGGDPVKGEAARQAIETNDYQAWKTAMADSKMTKEITEAQFSSMVRMHQLMDEGEFEAAQAVAEEAGLKFKMMRKGAGVDGEQGVLFRMEKPKE